MGSVNFILLLCVGQQMSVLGTSMFRPLYPHLFDNNFVYMARLGSLTIRQQEMCIVANIHPAVLLHGLDKSHLFLGQPASPTP